MGSASCNRDTTTWSIKHQIIKQDEVFRLRLSVEEWAIELIESYSWERTKRTAWICKPERQRLSALDNLSRVTERQTDKDCHSLSSWRSQKKRKLVNAIFESTEEAFLYSQICLRLVWDPECLWDEVFAFRPRAPGFVEVSHEVDWQQESKHQRNQSKCNGRPGISASIIWNHSTR